MKFQRVMTCLTQKTINYNPGKIYELVNLDSRVLMYLLLYHV